MQLAPAEVARFYSIWEPLILFVNQQRHIVPSLLARPTATAPWDPRAVIEVRNVLWADDPLLDAFVADNPASLPADDLALASSWRHRRAGTFTIYRDLKRYTVFLGGDGNEAFGVLGLASPIASVVPFLPCYVKAVLLPFGDRIIYDSLLNAYNVVLGPGIRSNLKQTYDDARERGGILTSLLPSSVAASPEEARARSANTNEKVLAAFRTHLYRSGLSPKVVERDLANVTAFAGALPEPQTLRDFGGDELAVYLAGLETPAVKEARRREARTSLKRFVRFLRDTERMDYWVAEDALDHLAGRA